MNGPSIMLFALSSTTWDGLSDGVAILIIAALLLTKIQGHRKRCSTCSHQEYFAIILLPKILRHKMLQSQTA